MPNDIQIDNSIPDQIAINLPKRNTTPSDFIIFCFLGIAVIGLIVFVITGGFSILYVAFAVVFTTIISISLIDAYRSLHETFEVIISNDFIEIIRNRKRHKSVERIDKKDIVKIENERQGIFSIYNFSHRIVVDLRIFGSLGSYRIPVIKHKQYYYTYFAECYEPKVRAWIVDYLQKTI